MSVRKEGISIPLGQEEWGRENSCNRVTDLDLAADMGSMRSFAQSDRAGVGTSVRENNWRLMLIIKFSNESISFPPVDGFSFPCLGVAVYKPSSVFHLPLLLRTKPRAGSNSSSYLPRWTGQEGMEPLYLMYYGSLVSSSVKWTLGILQLGGFC